MGIKTVTVTVTVTGGVTLTGITVSGEACTQSFNRPFEILLRSESIALKHSSRFGSCNRAPKTLAPLPPPPTKTAATRKTTKPIKVADSKRRGSLEGFRCVATYYKVIHLLRSLGLVDFDL